MTKQETKIMKGVAILMMLIVHLFGKTTEGYVSLVHIVSEPIEYLLRYAVSPVSFFLILSGYGMHFVCTKGILWTCQKSLKAYVSILTTL